MTDTISKFITRFYNKGLGDKKEYFYKLMDLLRNPQDKIKTIHISGTNGKGSTAHMLSNILIDAGYKTATFTSPHINKYNERIKIDNKYIPDEVFYSYMVHVYDTSLDLLKGTGLSLGFFDILTAVAFCYFADEQVDVAIIETGIGGLNDSTNVIKCPMCSVITSISYDHLDILGEDIFDISNEKAGIIKSSETVLFKNQKLVNSFIKSNYVEKNKSAKGFLYAGDSIITVNRVDLKGTKFSIKNNAMCYNDLFIKQLGTYQLDNVAGVINVISILNKKGMNISNKSIYRGLYNAKWQGRFELISKQPMVILDGAHNVSAIETLCKELKIYFPVNKIFIIFSSSANKDYKGMIYLLSRLAYKLIFTDITSFRAISSNDMYKSVEGKINIKDIVVISKLRKALNYVKKLDKNSVVVITGSLYLVAEASSILKSDYA